MTSFILGMDLGYGGSKLALGGPALEPTLRLMPSGAAPVSRLPRKLEGALDTTTGSRVLVDGVPYVAGVSPTILQDHTRVLDKDYPSTLEYRALFYAALRETRVRTIDVLVTGLPVKQHLAGSAVKDALIERLQGTHYIDGEGLVVEVKRVHVLPQPVGAYMDHLHSSKERVRPDAAVLVVDPGYYSADWVVIQEGHLRNTSSDTSMKTAMSVVLDQAQAAIANREEVTVNPDRIEEALRAERPTISVRGQDFDYRPDLAAAANSVATELVKEVKRSLRSSEDIDLIILAGGGAPLYAPVFREAFSRNQVIVSENPVMANARGFFYAGRRLMKAATT